LGAAQLLGAQSGEICRRCLLVGIDQKHVPPSHRPCDGKVDSQGGLPNAALGLCQNKYHTGIPQISDRKRTDIASTSKKQA
jgi:hypothetical protein